MEWISLEQEKPEENYCSYLVTDGIFVNVGFWHTHAFYDEDLLDDVTHWMPFPEPPNPVIKELNSIDNLDGTVTYPVLDKTI